MAKYRNNLPQLSDEIFLTDGGLETTLIFQDGIDLPEFAAFYLLKDPAGTERLREYYSKYASLARDSGAGFVLESVTWRANSDWGRKLGMTDDELADLNRKSIDLLREIRDRFETARSKMVISGCIGPRGDGYVPTDLMSTEEAENYHAPQIEIFSRTEADMVSAFTINYVEEAIGIAQAAEKAGMPVVISFTVETDGKLPTGQTLREAIENVDAATNNYPAYYMINCAHPTHFADALETDAAWTKRIRGVRANSSVKSHAELNESTELDEGNPPELGRQYRGLLLMLPNLRVLGGCCGTDFRHVSEIAAACLAPQVERELETV